MFWAWVTGWIVVTFTKVENAGGQVCSGEMLTLEVPVSSEGPKGHLSGASSKH